MYSSMLQSQEVGQKRPCQEGREATRPVPRARPPSSQGGVLEKWGCGLSGRMQGKGVQENMQEPDPGQSWSTGARINSLIM